MTARILAQASPGEVRIAVVDADGLLDYAIWRPGVPNGVGDLLRGRVIARAPALAGAFIALEEDEGFLPDTEGGAALAAGACVGVRVIRAAQAGKGPRLSARLTEDDRTLVGAGPPALIRRGTGPLAELARRHPRAPIRTDSPMLAAALRAGFADRLELVAPPLWDEAAEASVDALAAPSVPLPGGGSLSIHPTAALVAIDLDLGGRAGVRAEKQRAHEELNSAALPVLARQIRLRNLSGAILVDWAGLSPRRRAALGPPLAAALASDPLRPRLVGFTGLGLAEIVRPRVHPPLHEMLAGPHAAGLAALRRLAADPSRPARVRVSADVAAALQADRLALDEFRHLTGRTLTLNADPALGRCAWRIEGGDG
ncbi:MAG TPA: ribonuclease E/G [Acetobacteraceae bacterium]|nr:ribonuclease E/G [Acetobacteraceae bacterium]